MKKLALNNTFTTQLPADKEITNTSRQVFDACFSYVTPIVPSNPKLIHVANEFAQELGFTIKDVSSTQFLETFSGAKIYPNTNPFAMCYGGHQFGNWAAQLGDGRAINLFEINHNHNQWTFQLKGAGKTPYSRNADGLAVLRSSIREYLCSEAMHYLGIPTTRALSLIETGDSVLRDVLYNGNSALEKGAIVCRVAPSFIRFGNFEILAARKNYNLLKQLADYTIAHFYSHITTTGSAKYLQFFNEIANATLQTIINWQRVGFVHGVMNTDNMSILGLTIDYGPYGWLEDYNPNWTPNTTDSQNKRYRFENQPDIAVWNIIQLANALFYLIDDVKSIEEVIENCMQNFSKNYQQMQQNKLGLNTNYNKKIHHSLHENLIASETDFTIFYRNLATIIKTDTPEIALQKVAYSFYNPNEITNLVKTNWLNWFDLYINTINSQKTTDEDRKTAMNKVNPKYVLRNYMAQLAIDDANNGNYKLLDSLYQLLKNPYSEQPENEKWFAKRPEWAKNKVGCSMLSCSS